MRLTLFSDYALRVLLYLGLNPEEIVTIDRISESFKVSRNHLVKVVHQLAKKGFIQSFRGKGGGIRLARDPKSYRLGDVIRSTEPDLDLVECFNSQDSLCPITGVCELEAALLDARGVFMEKLNEYTLADLVSRKSTRETKRILDQNFCVVPK